MTMAMALNFVATALSMLGLMGPVAGALVHNVGSVLVVLSSASLVFASDKEAGPPLKA
jgi:cation transport ATPase